jgi:hypothetical protein
MSAQDRVAAHEFAVETKKDAAAIREAGTHAVEAGRRFLTNTIKEAASRGSMTQYLIKGPGGIVQQMLINVRWRDLGNGRRSVTLEVPSFLTTRPTFMFIPIGPKSVPAMGSLKRFSAALRAELEA